MMQRLKDSSFVIGFLLYLVILYVDSYNTSAKSRAFPMVIIIVAFIAVGLKLLTFKFARLRFLDPSGNIAKDILHMDDGCNDGIDADAAESKDQEADSLSVPVKIFLFMLWLITFAVGVYFIGFLPTMAVWLFIFMAGISRIKVLKSLMLSAGTFAVLYIVFVMLLSTHFPRGILF